MADEDRYPTFADHLDEAELDAREVLESARDIAATYNRRRIVTLERTGIILEVLSDGALHIDVPELDRLTAMVIGASHSGVDPEVAQLMRCYHERLTTDADLAGRRLRLVVPADPRECFNDFVLAVPAMPGQCDSTGLSLPEIDAELRIFGRSAAHLSTLPTIIIAPGSREDGDASRDAALILAHELVHFFDNEMGNFPANPNHRESHRPYERRAYQIERTLDKRSRDGLLKLPVPISYVEHP